MVDSSSRGSYRSYYWQKWGQKDVWLLRRKETDANNNIGKQFKYCKHTQIGIERSDIAMDLVIYIGSFYYKTGFWTYAVLAVLNTHHAW